MIRNLLLASAVALLAAGCGTVRTVLRPAQTNAVPVVTVNTSPRVTQEQVVSTSLNPVPGLPDLVVTNLVTRTNWVTSIVTNVVQVVTPEVVYNRVSIDPAAAGMVTTLANAAPVPWAGTAASVAVGIGGIVAAWINKRREKKALEEKFTFEDVAGQLVQDLETLRKAALEVPEYKAKDAAIMRTIQERQRDNENPDVKPIITALVDEKTDYTKKV